MAIWLSGVSISMERHLYGNCDADVELPSASSVPVCRFSSQLDICDICPKPGYACDYRQRMASKTLVIQISGVQVQIHFRLDGNRKTKVPLE